MANDKTIWDFLKNKGLNDYAVAGIMGNLHAESALNPKNLQQTYEKKLGYTDDSYTAAVDNGSYTNFVKDSAGYGLAQWTYWSRKQNLLSFAKAAGKSIGDLTTQLYFLWQELQGYKGVMQVLNCATSVLEASNVVLMQYERPADTGAAVQSKRAGYGQQYYDKYATKSSAPASDILLNGQVKTAEELATALKSVAQNFKTLYVMGCFGAPMTAANKQRYCNNHSYNKAAARTALIKAASADTFGFDCVNLIKGILWGWRGDTTKTYGGATYASNGVPDINADTIITKCADISTDFSKVPVGALLWCKGHVGVYIGDGLAVECTPSWENKVQITAVKNIGAKAGYNARMWTKHGKLPYITYTSTPAQPVQPVQPVTPAPVEPTQPTSYKVGDVVNFTGNKHYTSANAASGKACKAGKAKVTQVYQLGKSKHPYHLVREEGGGSNVYGWVDAADINGTATAATPAAPTVRTHKVVKGDNLTKISKKYGTTINAIVVANKKKYPKITANYIVVGWELVV